MEEKVMYVRLDESCRALKAYVTGNGEIAIQFEEPLRTEKIMKVVLPEDARAWKAWIEGNGEIAISYKKQPRFIVERES